jgi:hypothetical protein
MEKFLYAWRNWSGTSFQSFAIPIPLVFLPYESKEALGNSEVAVPKVCNKRIDVNVAESDTFLTTRPHAHVWWWITYNTNPVVQKRYSTSNSFWKILPLHNLGYYTACHRQVKNGSVRLSCPADQPTLTPPSPRWSPWHRTAPSLASRPSSSRTSPCKTSLEHLHSLPPPKLRPVHTILLFGGRRCRFPYGERWFFSRAPNTALQKSNATHFFIELVWIFEKWHSRRCAEA